MDPAGDESDDGRGVTADVEDCAAAEAGVVQSGMGVERGWEAVGGAEEANLADGLLLDQIAEDDCLGVDAVGEVFH